MYTHAYNTIYPCIFLWFKACCLTLLCILCYYSWIDVSSGTDDYLRPISTTRWMGLPPAVFTVRFSDSYSRLVYVEKVGLLSSQNIGETTVEVMRDGSSTLVPLVNPTVVSITLIPLSLVYSHTSLIHCISIMVAPSLFIGQ